MCCPFLKSVGKFDDATRLNVLAVSKEADLKGGSSMTRGKSLSLINKSSIEMDKFLNLPIDHCEFKPLYKKFWINLMM